MFCPLLAKLQEIGPYVQVFEPLALSCLQVSLMQWSQMRM